MKTASWVIKELGTGRIIIETYSQKVVGALNTTRYQAVPIQDHLAQLNRKLKLGALMISS